jgi:hypothetical protein
MKCDVKVFFMFLCLCISSIIKVKKKWGIQKSFTIVSKSYYWDICHVGEPWIDDGRLYFTIYPKISALIIYGFFVPTIFISFFKQLF